MRTAIYARVSTAEQTADNQLLSLRTYAAARGFEIVAEYVDTASGARADRPQFTAMMQDARRARFSLLIFWSLDRISRRGVFHTLEILQELERSGVKIFALQQPFLDTTGAMGPAIIALFAALAQTERDLLRERTKAGLQRARAAGRQLGRPRRIADVVSIEEMRSQGRSWPAIAAATGLSTATAKRRFRQAQERQQSA
jgi:DNA invertase Pin-like site-specific DNA recombinase